jgi:asparagine synthase (glutamine-hydrolysing)
MCGFTGYLTSHSTSSAVVRDNSYINVMTKALVHRGPNSEGHWSDPNTGVYLGHRRLSIVDLSPEGHQPKISPSQRYVIAFNGEIYNH